MNHPLRVYLTGYQRGTPATFHRRLQDAGVQVLLDIRRKAYSSRPDFCAPALAASLRELGIGYVHVPWLGMPAALLVRRDGDNLPILDAYAAYLPTHTAGIAKVLERYGGLVICAMCMEADPATCHRSRLGDYLRRGYDGMAVEELPELAASPTSHRALSLLQPWASLMALPNPLTGRPEKEIETRSWSTPYRGPLAIHVSKRWRPEDVELAKEEPFLDVWRRHGIRRLSELPLGAVIAVAELADCIRTEDLQPGRLSAQERAFGNYGPDRYAWVLRDVQVLAQPVQARGYQGLWPWEMPEGTVLRPIGGMMEVLA